MLHKGNLAVCTIMLQHRIVSVIGLADSLFLQSGPRFDAVVLFHIGVACVFLLDPHREPLCRVSTQVCVFNTTPGPDIIPRLLDAKINGMAQLEMNINGIEEIDGTLYAQS